MSEPNYKKYLFWGAVTGLSSVFLYSCYEIVKFFYDEEDDGDYFKDGVLTDEGAVKLLIKINQLSDQIFQEQYGELDTQRRAQIENQEKYIQLIQQTIQNKGAALLEASNQILSKLTKTVTIHDLNAKIQSIKPDELEEMNLRLDDSDEGDELQPEKAKEAFKYYANMFIDEHTKFKEKYNNFQEFENEEVKNEVIFELQGLKVKINDMLFIKYGVTEFKIKKVLYKNHMMNDPEVKLLYEKIAELDQDNN